jgi:hypothetical protein
VPQRHPWCGASRCTGVCTAPAAAVWPYLTVGSGNSKPIIRVEPNALKEVGRFGASSSGLTNTTTRFVASRWMGMVSAYGTSGRVDFLLTGSMFNDVGLLRADTMAYVWVPGRR